MAQTRQYIDCRARVIASANIRKMREIAKAVYDSPAPLLDFECDPNGMAERINGFVTPEGIHIHIANSCDLFYPEAQDGVIGADEIRLGSETFSLVGCG